MDISYNELFDIPDGAKLTHCISTTMSMSPEEQLRIICAARGIEKLNIRDITGIILWSKDKFRFYFDDRKTDMLSSSVLGSPYATAALLRMNSAAPTDKAVFHPKIILIRFELDGEAHYRLLISSRNLTSANDVFETGAQFVSAPRRDDAPNHNIHELLEYLQGGESSELTAELKERDLIIPAVKDSSVRITVSGINGRQQDEELVKLLEAEKAGQKKQLYILSPDYETAKEKLESHRVFAPKGIKTHAKLYYLPEENGGTVWLGSCNLSERAMNGTNVECMAKITNVGEYFSVGNDTFTVFGTECEPVKEAKKYEGASRYGVIEKLAEFVRSSNFGGDDHIKAFKRYSKVEIQPSFAVKGNEEIEYLPLGYPEKDDNNNSRWKKLNKEYKLSFQLGTKKAGDRNGMLRVRLTENGVSAEAVVVFDKKAYSERFDKTISFRDFIYIPWLELLMEAKDMTNAKMQRDIFMETLEKAEKSEGLTAQQRTTLSELKDIYESAFNDLDHEEQ